MSAPGPSAGESVAEIAAGVRGRDRRALARAITLVESERPDHRAQAEALLQALLPATGQAIRLGISGAPGVGKSTFIEAFGLHLVEMGKWVAVLAVDPTSQRSGGSILGDKTRMERLARSEQSFIRPTPSGRTLGGVARRTREAMLLCEAGGYDVVIVETVGVGQSEAAVAAMVDMFVLLIAPGGGDDLQGIKRGIVELAEFIVVNKTDGDLAAAAGRIAADYTAALGLLRPLSAHWQPEVIQCSAIEGKGIAAVWQAVCRQRQALKAAGESASRRTQQAKAAMWGEVTESVLAHLREEPRLATLTADLERRVAQGELSVAAAAERIVKAFRRGPDEGEEGD
ncbi:MAG: methylmalonyl Co-A mutase-associated GTPase MeaB [Alphaproteobacteria bacterium]|nr:methylmalonyl Co-A mutase-associated GTPase MeaB [Alphaproteobacteria bacterium]